MDDEDTVFLKRWLDLSKARGIAGAGARETDEEKRIVEKSIIEEFSETLQKVSEQLLTEITYLQPPLPDFSCKVGDKKIHIELTEFMDEKLIMQAKHIRSNTSHSLHDQGLWFDTSYEWFSDLLHKIIDKKERRYQTRDIKIDVLLIWNELGQVSYENINAWLQKIEVPELRNINSIYFQSWYHPKYLGRPVWSIIDHKEIGQIIPTLKTDNSNVR